MDPDRDLTGRITTISAAGASVQLADGLWIFAPIRTDARGHLCLDVTSVPEPTTIPVARTDDD